MRTFAVQRQPVTQLQEGCRMRIERSSLIAVALLFLAGCSAHRQALQTDSESDATDPVPMPIRHADEYDFRNGDHEYEPSRSSGDRSGPSSTPVPPPVRLEEPAPAPPAIGISRVKSVSWLRGVGRRSESINCGDDACGDGCSTAQQTILSSDYFTENCGPAPHTRTAPPVSCGEKAGFAERLHGWNLLAKKSRPKEVRKPSNCGEGTAHDPGFIVPEGCDSSVKDSKPNRHSRRVVKQYVGGVAVEPRAATHGNHRSSLADPLQEDGWQDRGGSGIQRCSPDELLELPSTLESTTSEQSPQNAPGVPIPQTAPAPPVPEAATRLFPTPTIHPTGSRAAARRHINPGTVNQIVQPPMWPRLGSDAATYGNSPVVGLPVAQDPSLPVIQPGRRI